ncbi:hypothetical protein L207DRAFT_514065 [Hyaloscypha variabilis F]|uniref:Uncharacterized protein n=1 Tax=Hyaloscypha variabilis (strain UAMH 11265 / GT02V1 / F) TaxID=1149755 RepID=A0A2J6RI19_HYAVF|nr:hypothetical protein L207DRAFT_514065 [Hyaloscypha variabilis F]
MAMPDGSLILTTVVIASMQTITPQVTSATSCPLPSSTTTAPSSLFAATMSVSPGSLIVPAATSNNSLEIITPSSMPATLPATASTPTLLAASQASSL